MNQAIAKISELLDKRLAGTDLFVVDIKKLPKARIQVFLDSDTSLTIQQCADISRYLEFNLENEGLVPEHYTLEVSSPGVDQPLKFHRQYQKNLGRKVKVTLKDGSQKKGKLKKVTENEVILENEMDKKKKTKKEDSQEEELTIIIPFDNIASTKVLISFN